MKKLTLIFLFSTLFAFKAFSAPINKELKLKPNNNFTLTQSIYIEAIDIAYLSQNGEVEVALTGSPFSGVFSGKIISTKDGLEVKMTLYSQREVDTDCGDETIRQIEVTFLSEDDDYDATKITELNATAVTKTRSDSCHYGFNVTSLKFEEV